MAAEVLAQHGRRVDLYEAMPSVGRKFLLAGKGGLNLTHSEAFEPMVARYGAASEGLRPMLQRFGATELRNWAQGLGIETFVGSSGRVFPREMKAAPLLRRWLQRLRAMGGTPVEIDFTPLREAQAILYDGPWIAERTTWLAPAIERYGEHLHPVTRQILASGNQYSACDLFRAQHRLAQIKQFVRTTFKGIDVLVVPSTPTTFSKAQVLADPIALNSKLGIYTNFVNLLGMCGVAVPNGFRGDGLPQGITFLAPELCDARVASFGDAYGRVLGGTTGGPVRD
jgi:Asp-tRNA(Asn)/Glu-tRNA(Gln) amidotransferase A subunit family amidase